MTGFQVGKIEKNNTKAVVSLVVGIIALLFIVFVWIGMILGLLGMILGVIALLETKKTAQKGKYIAIAGVVCNLLAIILPIIIIFVIFNIYMNPSVT
ncbi:DUF4190 domain-containing protein [Bacillus shivajii]|uniref:DUF4190 domain-containing protein n=1 Tax=Bacillus shivajii TaxID=1983719 RepID=UPI001CFAE159|nr:DUF4190 domain-containing protein [Bacillus shivajii]UCZ52216.1 DUF4190 domain-containing protein [Bacillus shivajii]